MRDCDTCIHKGEGVMGDHCGKCVIQEQTPTQYEPKGEYTMTWEVAAHNVADRIRELERENAELKKQIDAPDCRTCKFYNHKGDEDPCNTCVNTAQNNWEAMSNGDWLRSMTNQQLAVWFDSVGACLHVHCPDKDCASTDGQYEKDHCIDVLRSWLESQRSEGDAS